MPDYLIKGETLINIADAIRSETGTTAKINPDNMGAAISSIVTLKEGTADATATAQDMAQGTTAYVDGELIEGELPIVNEYYNANFILNGIWDGHPESQGEIGVDGYPVYAEFSLDERTIVDPSYYFLELPLNNFGNATTADVRSGKTFTGANGLYKVGTMEEFNLSIFPGELLASGGVDHYTSTPNSLTIDLSTSPYNNYSILLFSACHACHGTSKYGAAGKTILIKNNQIYTLIDMASSLPKINTSISGTTFSYNSSGGNSWTYQYRLYGIK